tara:strand:- start:19 stop:690 length:672 start_codon:yes stop_codon:yes gene_type:complete
MTDKKIINYEEIITDMNDDDYLKAYKNYFKYCPRKVLEDEMNELYHTLDYYTNNDKDDNNYFIDKEIDLTKYINIKKCSLSKMNKTDLIDYCKKLQEDNKYIENEKLKEKNEKLKEENEKIKKDYEGLEFKYNTYLKKSIEIEFHEDLQKEYLELEEENKLLKEQNNNNNNNIHSQEEKINREVVKCWIYQSLMNEFFIEKNFEVPEKFEKSLIEVLKDIQKI